MRAFIPFGSVVCPRGDLAICDTSRDLAIEVLKASHTATLGCHGPATTTVSFSCRQDYAQAVGQARLDPSGFGHASAQVVFGAFDRRGYPRGLIIGVAARLLRRLALVGSG